MAYTTTEGRQQLLDWLTTATDEIAFALASLGAAYEALDQTTADGLEDELFGPVQRAYGRAKRAHSAFAERSGLTVAPFDSRSPGVPSIGPRGFIDNAVAAIGVANGQLSTLQDSAEMLEVGDAELRQGVAELRALIDDFPLRARDFTRRLGR